MVQNTDRVRTRQGNRACGCVRACLLACLRASVYMCACVRACVPARARACVRACVRMCVRVSGKGLDKEAQRRLQVGAERGRLRLRRCDEGEGLAVAP